MSRAGRWYWSVSLLATATPALPATTSTVNVSELAHCAAIIAVDQRLACYDTLALSKMPPKPVASAASAPAAGAAAAAAPATGKTAVAAAAAPGFGMATHVSPAEVSTQEIVAHVIGGSADTQGNVFVTLDNGQVWTYSDQWGVPPIGAAVTIRRAALGSYLITTPSHRSYRALRTK